MNAPWPRSCFTDPGLRALQPARGPVGCPRGLRSTASHCVPSSFLAPSSSSCRTPRPAAAAGPAGQVLRAGLGGSPRQLAGRGGAGAEGGGGPHGAWSQRRRALSLSLSHGLPSGCRALWSRPPPLPCWIVRPPEPGRSWKFSAAWRGGRHRLPRRGCLLPGVPSAGRSPGPPTPPPPSFPDPEREAPRCGCCE